MNTKKVLVIGSLNMDFVVEVSQLPAVGETVLGGDMNTIPGGKGGNQAFAAGKLGGSVALLGCVGDDSFGTALLDSLSMANVDTSYVRRTKKAGTGIAMIWVDKSANNSIVVSPSANSLCLPEYLSENRFLLEQCTHLVLQMEIPLKTVHSAIETAHELNKCIILNPAPVPDVISQEIFKHVDYITPNETELQKLLQMWYPEKEWDVNSIESIVQGAQKISADLGCKVLVTAGEQGAILVTKNEHKHYPAKKVNAIDTTAAGDCFTAAFAVALSEEKSESDAILFANAAASVTVTRKGAQTSLPTRDETDNA